MVAQTSSGFLNLFLSVHFGCMQTVCRMQFLHSENRQGPYVNKSVQLTPRKSPLYVGKKWDLHGYTFSF